MVVLILAAILITGAISVLYAINNMPGGMPGGSFLFAVGLALLLTICFIIGMEADTQIQSTKPIKPTLKINCTNSKCDTIYVYEEPGDNS
jgi:hypothetical protein